MPRLPDCRIVGKELTFVFPSNGDAFVGYRMIRDAVEAVEKERAAPIVAPFEDLTGTVWVRHKTGSTYKVMLECRIEATQAPAVAYIQFDGGSDGGFVWVRPRKEFLDGRFQRATSAKQADASKPPLRLRVGAHYKRSDGMTGSVIFRSTTSDYFLWESTDGLRRTYNEDGTSRHQFEGVKNLIEEIAPPLCPTLHDCKAGQTERCTCCDKEG